MKIAYYFFFEKSLSLGLNTYNAAVALTTLESYYTVCECIECVVATHAYVLARVVYCTALTHDDVTCDASLTTPDLNT